MAKLRWTVEFAVDESWVADGFDLTDERAKGMLAQDLRYAYGHELGAKVLVYPSTLRVAKLQGYRAKDIAEGVKKVQQVREDGRLKRGE